MATTIKREAQLLLDEGDVADILTDKLCSYNELAGLRVTAVSKDDAGTFTLVLSPREPPEAA